MMDLGPNYKLESPSCSHHTHVFISQLLDLCMLDVRCLEFSNGVLAASALFHFSSLDLVENVSGKDDRAWF